MELVAIDVGKEVRYPRRRTGAVDDEMGIGRASRINI
jgi:hypothetical protein